MMRIGNGYDVHKLVEGRKLVLGGVVIPHDKGVLGHSDGDVLIHAVMDAVLGALSLGDIGKHFPDTDMKYEGIDSKILLKKVYEIMSEKGYKIGNLDSIIVAQKPKLKDYIDEMRKRMAEILHTDIENVSVKATTEEKLGFTGNEEGIKSYSPNFLRTRLTKVSTTLSSPSKSNPHTSFKSWSLENIIPLFLNIYSKNCISLLVSSFDSPFIEISPFLASKKRFANLYTLFPSIFKSFFIFKARIFKLKGFVT